MCGVQGEHRVAPGPNKNDLQDEREFAPHQQERAQPTATARMQRTSNASTASSSQRIGDLRVDAPSRKPAPQQHRSQQKPAETGAKHRSQAGNNSANTASQQSNASTAPSTAANANQVQRVPATPTATQVKG